MIFDLINVPIKLYNINEINHRNVLEKWSKKWNWTGGRHQASSYTVDTKKFIVLNAHVILAGDLVQGHGVKQKWLVRHMRKSENHMGGFRCIAYPSWKCGSRNSENGHHTVENHMGGFNGA